MTFGKLPVKCDILPGAWIGTFYQRQKHNPGELTLGGGTDEQVIDGLETEYKKSFLSALQFSSIQRW